MSADGAGDGARAWVEGVMEAAAGAGRSCWRRLTSSRAEAVYMTVLALTVVLGVLWLSWTLAGPIATIVYVVLFGMAATFIPVYVALGGTSVAGRSLLGTLHFVMEQLAFGGGYLVQREHGWERCPGDRERVYIDGRWHRIEGGGDTLSVLGWQLFGVLRYKTPESLRDARVDPAAEAATGRRAADGSGGVERGGYRESAPDARVSGLDGAWLVDLKRVLTEGVRQIGDPRLIEKAEEVTKRSEAKSSRARGWETIIATVVGLLLGIGTGYVMLVG